jgi:replicative DNA helicase
MMAEYLHLEQEEPLHSIQMEMATLGSALLGDREITRGIRAILPDPEKFYRPAHRSIWAACLALMDACIPCDLEFVTEYILDKQEGTEGDIDYLNQVAEYVPSPSLGEDYAKQVLDYWTRRQYAELANKAKRMSPEQLHIEAEAIKAGAASKTNPTVVKMGTLSGDAPEGLPSGWAALDSVLSCGGWPKGQFTVIRARTGRGKTPFMTQAVVEAAKRGEKVLYATFADLSPKELQDRMMKYLTGWAHSPTVSMFMADDWQEKKQYLLSLGIDVYDGTEEGIGTIEAFSLFVERREYTLVAADYIQKIDTQRWIPDRKERQAYISARLKRLAAKCHIPLLVGAQVSNNLQEGDITAGGRDTDDDAGLIIDIKRPDDDDPQIIRIPKSRFGDTCEIPLEFDKTHLKFILGGQQ